LVRSFCSFKRDLEVSVPKRVNAGLLAVKGGIGTVSEMEDEGREEEGWIWEAGMVEKYHNGAGNWSSGR
jgi:hypothetical protein